MYNQKIETLQAIKLALDIQEQTTLKNRLTEEQKNLLKKIINDSFLKLNKVVNSGNYD